MPHHFFPSASPSFPSAEGMNAGGYGNLLMNSEQPQGEYGVTVAFLRLITTLVKVKSGQIESAKVVSLLLCCCCRLVCRQSGCPEVMMVPVCVCQILSYGLICVYVKFIGSMVYNTQTVKLF